MLHRQDKPTQNCVSIITSSLTSIKVSALATQKYYRSQFKKATTWVFGCCQYIITGFHSNEEMLISLGSIWTVLLELFQGQLVIINSSDTRRSLENEEHTRINCKPKPDYSVATDESECLIGCIFSQN